MTTVGERCRRALLGLWRPLVIVAAGAAAYSNSFGGVFLLDDDLALSFYHVRDPLLGWSKYFTLDGDRPVALATLAANYAVGGVEPWGYHLVNLAIHLANALLLYALIGRTLNLSRASDRLRPRAADLAFASALVWAVHPLNTQAVTYVVQRMESLMALWYLAALYALNRGATAERWAVGRVWYTAAVAAAWLCVGTKEVGVTLPAVALLYDRCYLAGTWVGAVRNRFALYPAMAVGWVSLLPFFVYLSGTFATPGLPGEAEGRGPSLTWKDYTRTQPEVVLHYVRLSVWPRPQCFDTRWPVARTPDRYVPQSVAVGGLLALTLFALWRWPRVGFLPAAAAIVLSPTSSFVAIADLMFEHRMYLPLTAVVTLGVLAVDALLGRVPGRAVAGPVLLAAVAAGYGVLTYQRNELYRDPVVMWSDVVAQRPNVPRGHFWLGHSLVETGRFAEAVAPLRFFTGFDSSADPENQLQAIHRAEAHFQLGRALAGLGDDEAAVREFEAACRLSRPPRFSYARQRDAALRRLGRELPEE